MKAALNILAVLASLGLAACGTTSAEKKAETATQAEAPATGEGELAVRGANIIVNAPGLTTEQREQVMQVHTKTFEEATKLREELTQAKSALFKTLVSPASTKKEISALKNKVMTLDKQRLDLMMKAFDQVQKIVGKDKMDESMIKHFTTM